MPFGTQVEAVVVAARPADRFLATAGCRRRLPILRGVACRSPSLHRLRPESLYRCPQIIRISEETAKGHQCAAGQAANKIAAIMSCSGTFDWQSTGGSS